MKKEKKLENPMINGQKRIKSINVGSEDENIVRKFILIVVVIIILIIGVYAFTELTNKKESNNDVVSGEIDYNILSIGMLLNRPEKEYYTIIYDSENEDAILYSSMINTYITKNSKKDNYIKLYYCDLGNKLNSAYYNVNGDNKSNKNAESISELDLGELTLIKVKNGKITQYVEDYNTIKNILN